MNILTILSSNRKKKKNRTTKLLSKKKRNWNIIPKRTMRRDDRIATTASQMSQENQ